MYYNFQNYNYGCNQKISEDMPFKDGLSNLKVIKIN